MTATVLDEPLDHFPPLISYRALHGHGSMVEQAADVLLESPVWEPSEILTMPKRNHGTRGVEVLSPTTLAAYSRAVEELRSDLRTPTRDEGVWQTHLKFGTEDTGMTHLVDLDFASCYELIEHSVLMDEVLRRTFDQSRCHPLSKLLQGMGWRGRGLPQMLDASDLLADTYLDIFDRRLQARGFKLHRYADDVRIASPSWQAALEAVSFATDAARELGLILSSAKTLIRKKGTVLESDESRARLLKEFTAGEPVIVEGPYGSWEELEPEEMESRRSGFQDLLSEYATTPNSNRRRSALEPLVSTALSFFAVDSQSGSVPLSAAEFDSLLFEDKTRWDYVCQILRQAPSVNAEAGAAIRNIFEMETADPWTRLWKLHLAESDHWNPEFMLPVVRAYVNDRHEAVRAQAIWVLAWAGELDTEDLNNAALRATALTLPGLAAAAGKSRSSLDDRGRSIAGALKRFDRLAEVAHDWGEKE